MSETEVAQLKQHICNVESRNKILEDEVLALREQNEILQQWRTERESVDKKLDELRESVDKNRDELTSKIEKKERVMDVDRVCYVRNERGEGETRRSRELVKIQYLQSSKPTIGIVDADLKLQPTAHIVLSRATSHHAAFGETRVVLEDTPGKQFLFVSQANHGYTEEKRDYTEIFHDIRDMERAPIMLMTAGGLVIRRDNIEVENENRYTIVFTPDLEPEKVIDMEEIEDASYPKEYKRLYNTLGQLHGTLPEDRLLYGHKGIDKLDVYQLPKHDHVAYIERPERGFFGSDKISVSWHKASHWLAVVDTNVTCLDLYEAWYDHRTHVDLGYEPLPINAVACVGDVIVVANGESLHLYNWSGKPVGTASIQELGMAKQGEQEKKNGEQKEGDEVEEKEQEKTEVKIFGIGPAGVDMIHVITGTSCDEVKAVHLITII